MIDLMKIIKQLLFILIHLMNKITVGASFFLLNSYKITWSNIHQGHSKCKTSDCINRICHIIYGYIYELFSSELIKYL